MGVTNIRVYAILTACILVTAYFLFPIVLPPKLEFRERAFPRGFRELVLDSASSQIDPLFGMKQSLSAASKLNAREVCDALFRDPTSPAAGKRESQLQIVAFLDYRCPYCKKLSTILSQMQNEKARIVYKEWPILGDSSVLAAQAGLAADKQGKYLAFHTRLMNSRLIPTVAYIEEIAADLGMNRSQLRMDMNSVITAHAIQRTSALASTLSLVGTPALVVGRTIVQGEITRRELERLIENEIQQPEKPCEEQKAG
jgi:protein-disulfide isomerase